MNELRRFFKEALTENLGLKIIALFIAVMLYTLVRFQEKGERIIDVEVLPLLPPTSADLVVTNELPDKVRVRVRGPASRLNSIKPVRPVEIDMNKAVEGTSYYYFNEDSFDLPAGVEFVRVTPESIPIKIERLDKRKVPMSVRTSGQLKEGTELVDNPRVAPAEVTIIGPKSVTRGIKAVETEEVDLEGLGVGSYTRIVPVRRIEDVEIRGGDEMKVSFDVRWVPGRRTISNLLVRVEGTELMGTTTPKKVAVDLSGPEVVLENLDPAKLRPFVLLTEEQGARPGSVTGQVTLRGVPEGVEVSSVVPARVNVQLKPGPK